MKVIFSCNKRGELRIAFNAHAPRCRTQQKTKRRCEMVDVFYEKTGFHILHRTIYEKFGWNC